MASVFLFYFFSSTGKEFLDRFSFRNGRRFCMLLLPSVFHFAASAKTRFRFVEEEEEGIGKAWSIWWRCFWIIVSRECDGERVPHISLWLNSCCCLFCLRVFFSLLQWMGWCRGRHLSFSVALIDLLRSCLSRLSGGGRHETDYHIAMRMICVALWILTNPPRRRSFIRSQSPMSTDSLVDSLGSSLIGLPTAVCRLSL